MSRGGNEYLDKLAEFVTNTRLEDLADSTVAAAKDVVLDTIGAILAGSRLPENANFARLAQTLSGPGQATLFGHSLGQSPGQSARLPAAGDSAQPHPPPAGGEPVTPPPLKVQPVFAALVNATAGVALELDEGSRLGGGHPSIHVTPGAIAVAEELDASGKAALEAVIVGYEVTSRIGSGVQSRAEIHSHGTWGTIGAAAATASLLGFDAAETRQAMNLAMSMSPANTWTPCLEGATIRNLYPGRSEFQGIMAAYLVRCGFTGVNDGPADLYGSILGEGFDPAAVTDGWDSKGPGSPLRIEQNYFKYHACCLYNHPVLDAALTLQQQEGFEAAHITQIRVTAPPIVQIMANPAPENMLSAKFSIPYALAAALVGGETGAPAFYPEQVNDPAIRSLAQMVEVVADPEMSMRRYDYPTARVAITLGDGRVLEESAAAHHGDSHNPRPREELVGKFTALAGPTLGASRAAEVVAAVGRLETLPSIRELTALLGGGWVGDSS